MADRLAKVKGVSPSHFAAAASLGDATDVILLCTSNPTSVVIVCLLAASAATS
jgi:hypothetical protein